jgi:hypothetical protein
MLHEKFHQPPQPWPAIVQSTRVEVRHGPGAAGDDLFGSRAPRYEASGDLVLPALARAVAG